MNDLVILCERELPAEAGAPEWVHLLPARGPVVGRDGRRYVLNDPEGVVTAFKAHGADLPIDYHHQELVSGRFAAGPVPAAGWIKELKAETDGVWGRVEWTERAREMIAAKEYRYLSPVLHPRKDGEILSLGGAGLVHSGNLRLKALNAEGADRPTEEALDLVRRIMELPREVIEAAAARLRADTPDPAEYAPVAALQEALAERNAQLLEARAAEAKAKVDGALGDGHITPAMRGWAVALCAQDPASFDAFLAASAAPYAHLQRQLITRAHPNAEADSAAADEVCRRLGLPKGSLKA